MSLPQRLVRLRDGLAARRGVLFIGPDFAHGLPELDLAALVDGLAATLGDTAGWDELDADDRLTLAAQALGDDGLARALGDRLPSVEALRRRVRPFHRRLLGLPFPVIVDCAADDLVEAAIGEARMLASDDDLVLRPEALPGEVTVIKLRGDVLLGSPALTAAGLAASPQRRPALFARLRALAGRGPLLFYGFGPRDATLRWLVEALAPVSGTAVLAMRASGALWAAHWEARGFEVVAAPTVPELEARVEALCAALDPRVARPELDALVDEVGDRVARWLGPHPALEWARAPLALDAIEPAEAEAVRAGLDLLAAAAARGLPVPPGPAAIGAEALLRIGDLPGARQAVALAVEAMAREPARPDPTAAAAVGRALLRMGDPDRARGWLLRALAGFGEGELAARADALAWASRCLLDRVDRLQARKRERATGELIAAFLQGQSAALALARLEPPPDDEALRASIYYVNLRLGRVMGLASALADAAGGVYARQAVELLTRAIELMPARPDAYKAIRPLLTDRTSGAADPRRWMALVAGAPPAVQRKLGGR